MNNAPILLLQMQRMGDLVLSFPLLAWLSRLFPEHPIWVVGERRFFEPLMPLSPAVTYFNYGDAPDFRGLPFHAVINLSHRPEAASLAGTTHSDSLFGPYQDARGRLRIQGDWQLYRASLAHNNHYNRFHWADLNALDIIPSSLMLRTSWPLPRPLPGSLQNDGEKAGNTLPPLHEARIGLFLGASEREKHPDAPFWTALVRRLLQRGHKPVLLGGEAEQELGQAVANELRMQAINLCGRFSVSALAAFISELDLLVTPDTGPMHIAVWTGTPVLNLSLGPVNSWETGPFSPGHHVIRAAIDCVGCWRCTQHRPWCKEQMLAGRTAAVVNSLLGEGGDPASQSERAQGLELLRTQRGAYGLYMMETLFRSPLPIAEPCDATGRRREEAPHSPNNKESFDLRDSLSTFWQTWFGTLLGRCVAHEEQRAWEVLRLQHPFAAQQIRAAAAKLSSHLARTMRRTPENVLSEDDFWCQVAPPLRPLSGYLHMHMQNSLGARASFLHSLALLERIISLPS